MSQVGGTHYEKLDIQPWDAMRAWMSTEAFCGYLLGCAIKYLARYRSKGGVEDLEKSLHYIEKLIEEERAAEVARAEEASFLDRELGDWTKEPGSPESLNCDDPLCSVCNAARINAPHVGNEIFVR